MGGVYVGHAGGELRRQHAPAGSTRQQEARANARLCTMNAGTPTNVRVLQHARKCFITHKHKARKSSKRDGERRWGRGKRNKRACGGGMKNLLELKHVRTKALLTLARRVLLPLHLALPVPFSLQLAREQM